MNDDQLKREIEEALSVDPSPQFASRVRARTAEAARPSATWLRWSTAGLGVALVALVMAVVVRQPKEALPPAPVPVVRTATPPKPEVAAIPQQPAVTRHVARPLPPKTSEPEVLIDPRGVAAFRKFVERVQKDGIDLSPLAHSQDRALTIDEIALMPMDTLMPLMIEPLGGNL